MDIHRMPAALEWAAFACNREMPEIERSMGNFMVERQGYQPVGFCLAYFEPSGVVSIHAHYGDYLRQYTPQVMAGMAPVCQEIADLGVTEIYAIADEEIAGSTDLIVGLGGERTEHRNEEPPIGWIYRIGMDNPRMKRWLDLRGRGRK